MNIEHFYDTVMEKRYIKKLEKQKKQFRIAITLLYVVLGTLSLLYTQYWFLYSGTPTIDYSQLDSNYTIYAKKLISDVKPAYLEHVRSITFTRDILSIRGNTFQKIQNGESITFGTNIKFQRKIDVYLTGVEYEDRNILCHELLHSILYLGDEETFAYDISEYEVCYDQ